MAVRVVFDGPSRQVLGAVGRSIAVLLGAVLLVVGMLGVGLLVLVVLALVSDSGSNDGDRTNALVTGGVTLVVGTVSLLLAVRLLRGRRRLVLFLRRFGFDDATSTLTFASAKVIGRSWRLVTLDDDRVRAVGGSPGPRRLLGLIGLATTVALLGGGVWLLQGGPNRLIDRTVAGTDAGGGATDLGTVIGQIIAGVVVAALLVAVLLVLAIVTGVSSLFSVVSYGAARRGERAKSTVIASASDVRTRSAAVDRRSGRIFAPRLVVVRVADPVWQAAVREFAGLSDAVLVDVSQSSENLLWELSTLLPTLGNRCILVGRHDLLTDSTTEGQSGFNPALARILDGHTVLAYGTTERDVRRFARALEGFLAATTTSRA